MAGRLTPGGILVGADTNSLGRVRAAIAGYPIAAVLGLTFAWTWGLDLLLYVIAGPSPSIGVPPTTAPRTWGLLVATSIVILARGESVRGFLRAVITLPSRLWLLALALLIPIVVGERGTLLALLTGRSVSGPTATPALYVVGFLFVFMFAGALEEFGWRAYLQPRLQARYPAVFVALGIGAIWATWHLPLFLLFDLEPYDPSTLPTYYGTLMVDSVILAWLFNESGGSVLAPMVYHAAGNLPTIMAVSGTLPGVLGILDDHGYLASVVVLTTLVVALRGRELAADRLPVSRYWQ